MTLKHIAIMGCGFTGISAFYQLVDQYPVREITIFESTDVFGPGIPIGRMTAGIICSTTPTIACASYQEIAALS